VLVALSALAAAQEFPSRPLRIIVPYSAGGLPDVAMRVLASQLAAELGQPCTVENLPGSNAIVAVNALIAAPADGHTLLSLDAAQWAIIPAMNPHLPYDPLRDFAPVGLYGQNTGFMLVVGAAVPARTLQELVALARARPGELSYGSAGHGTAHHLMMEDFKAQLGLDILHVPYKGTAQSLPAVMGGQVSMTVAATSAPVLAQAKDGRIRILAVSTRTRSRLAPEVPTIAEAGSPGFEHRTALGLVVRAGTPRAVVDRLSAALRHILATAETIARFEGNGLEPAPDATPEALAARIRADRLLYDRIVRHLPAGSE
jgi:tripartite-type tricarboxylate transporter receptor subunit TctC